jgi:hypothetical protein
VEPADGDDLHAVALRMSRAAAGDAWMRFI